MILNDFANSLCPVRIIFFCKIIKTHSPVLPRWVLGQFSLPRGFQSLERISLVVSKGWKKWRSTVLCAVCLGGMGTGPPREPSWTRQRGLTREDRSTGSSGFA